jgi:hypothetical protein
MTTLRSQIRLLRELGLDRRQRRRVIEGEMLLYSRPTPADELIAIIQLDENRLTHGIFSINARDTGAGFAEFLRFIRLSRELAQQSGCQQLEIFGVAIVNAALGL